MRRRTGAASFQLSRRPCATAALLALLGGVTALGSANATAQTWSAEAAVSANLTASSNAALAPEGAEQNDLIGWLQPRLRLVGRGPRFDLNLDARVDLLGYARDTQPNRALPGVNADVQATLVERLLFIDAGLGVNQVESNPYGGRVVEGSTGNESTAGSYRIKPYLDYEISSRASVLALYEESGTRSFDDDLVDARSRLALVSYESKPLPLGWGIEASRLENLGQVGDNQALSNDALRVRASATFDGELIVGAVIGREHSKFLSTDTRDTIYGLRVDWAPGPRTRLLAVVEHRFFGVGGELGVSYRTPLMALSLKGSRGPTTAATLSTPISGRADLGAFLDSILKARYPEPADRAPIVGDTAAQRGFESQPPSSIYIIADYPQLQTGGNGTLVLHGTRTTVALTAYYQQLRLLQTSDQASTAPTLVADADSRQAGASIEFVRRLNRQMSASALLRWSQINGLEARSGDETSDLNLRLALTRQLAPRTWGSIGVQQRLIRSNIGGENRFAETAALIGLNHRF
ncbi:TIGR03016 family PEP-CTERM system-associated outer membrane protein [Rivibacter subsaxonicus]|uniref:Uncharacterized protein (PEP-CTERM system associated) n=1 Tax=Rivibacter subsaxonicus TaxID=457575 RepID=A0A4Q7VWA9_9BURK|nr:TIGR03016 family PEP-CTERM system-associated outer membrane protein [Rivibacter subsaxonicus]RZU00775.1 uncharacterized protein (PEP-CTERM system associated) [Rivibacter subsaxonicus]